MNIANMIPNNDGDNAVDHNKLPKYKFSESWMIHRTL